MPDEPRPHGEHPHLGRCDCDDCQSWDSEDWRERMEAQSGKLVLRRRLHQAVLIGDTVRIEVARLTPHTVTLAIEAPQVMTILREELQQREEGER